MEKLVQLIRSINKRSEVRDLVKLRIHEFRENGNKSTDEIYKELCFCILTAKFNAEKCIRIQKEIDDDFLTLSESQLAKKLKELSHRYPNTRAKYIVDARMCKEQIKERVSSHGDKQELRDWLVVNIRGIGYKEASHFLRNIGFNDFAIIDFHIIDLLMRFGLIKKPKNIGKKKYLAIEKALKKMSEELNMNLAELDLYMWYHETGKILK